MPENAAVLRSNKIEILNVQKLEGDAKFLVAFYN